MFFLQRRKKERSQKAKVGRDQTWTSQDICFFWCVNIVCLCLRLTISLCRSLKLHSHLFSEEGNLQVSYIFPNGDRYGKCSYWHSNIKWMIITVITSCITVVITRRRVLRVHRGRRGEAWYGQTHLSQWCHLHWRVARWQGMCVRVHGRV